MKRPLVLLLSALLPLVAQAQVPTGNPTGTRSSTTVAPPPVAPPVQPARPQPQPLPSPQPRQPIKATGPAPITTTPAPALPDKVYDRNGRIVPGVKPVGPNRVFDSRTGRYYDSVPQGTGQQIKP
ncbi:MULTISPECIES: classical arabinogalactan protein 4 [Stenotrophomonas]|uniref:classical arabinogalactan protein 4 n=1 Tax=Stenotrophomonas TaxID=40323 RepID=UPI000D53CBDE|nr:MULTISPECIES: classical arabinogalactan protein 4 [Stenotrophomonas]AWH27907.1 classical arabinogalactan protein 4 [Stenotrophomonas sp. YAU14A_MKIMI4_1]